MAKLNQIIAVEKGMKATVEAEVSRAYHLIQKADVFAGLRRVYQPKDEQGEKLPGEAVNVIATVPQLVSEFTAAQVELFDIVATKVYANTEAKADVVLDQGNSGEVVLLRDVPVEYLLFLEKRLADCLTFVSKLPTLDPAVSWNWDDAAAAYRSEVVKTNRSQKVPKNHEKAPATDKHAAQVEVYMEDVVVGVWEKTMFSGAVPITTINTWKSRILALQKAVKMAREEANSIAVNQQAVGATVLHHLFSEALGAGVNGSNGQ